MLKHEVTPFLDKLGIKTTGRGAPSLPTLLHNEFADESENIVNNYFCKVKNIHILCPIKFQFPPR